MDAVKFLKEAGRMCRIKGKCLKCVLAKTDGDSMECRINLMHILNHNEIEYCVRVVEEWAKKHPKKTRLSEFVKMFPNCQMNDGIPVGCIRFWDDSEHCRKNISCEECAKEFWNEEVVEESEAK